jgi:uncharacterized membrane protein
VVLVGILRNYPRYLPPDFTADFLVGRRGSFDGAYAWAFYAHLISGPLALLLGLLLIDSDFRRRFALWHRALGRVQGANVLLLLVPSGLWMAGYADGGIVARLGFALLAVATGLCVACGWRAAVARQIDNHRRWMQRCFVLLCSAVFLRLISAVATLTGASPDWLYPLLAWTTWVVPLLVNEVVMAARPDRPRPSS